MKYIQDYFLQVCIAITVGMGTFLAILIRKALTNEKALDLLKAEIVHRDEKITRIYEEVQEIRRWMLNQNKS